MSESADRRVLGAFRYVDAITGDSVANPIPVKGTDLVVKANRRGIYVVFDAPGMSALTSQFLPSAWPAPSPFEVAIQDPAHRYLPRRAKVFMPRALTAASDAASVLNPQTITLYPGAAAPIGPNWAVIRASVTKSGSAPPVGLPWAVVRVLRSSDQTVLATGMADGRGEALLAITGLSAQVNAAAGGAVMQASLAVTVQAWFDPAVLDKAAGWIPNPDDILENLASATLKTGSVSKQISAGVNLPVEITISV